MAAVVVSLLVTALMLSLCYGLFAALRALWRGGAPAPRSGGSSLGGQPWTPYQEPGAPMGPGPGLVTGLVVGHWLGEHSAGEQSSEQGSRAHEDSDHPWDDASQ